MRGITIVLLLVAAALAGCGGDDEESAATATPTAEATQAPAAGGEAVAVSAPADGALKFDQAELTAPAGKVTFDFDNPSTTPHALEIEGNGVEAKTDVITESKASVERGARARGVQVLLPGRLARRRRHGGDAHRAVIRRATSPARKSKMAARSRRTISACAISLSGQNGSA